MNESYDRIQELLEELRELDEGPTRTSVLREIIRHADVIGERRYQFHFRAAFVESAFYSGEADEMLVALSWCLAEFDKTPDEFGSPEVAVQLMSYALAYITNFPSVSLEKIDELVNDFERRCLQASTGLRRMYLQRTRIAFWTGNFDAAKKYYSSFWESSKDGGWSDDFERVFRVDFHAHVGDHAMACQEAEPVVKQEGPAEGPQLWVCALVIESLVRQKRMDDAQRCYQRGYKACRNNPKYLGLVSMYMSYLLAVGDLEQAFQLFDRHAQWAEETSTVDNRFKFCAASWRMFDLLEKGGTKTLRVQLPAGMTPNPEQTEFTPRELGAWFETETKRIAELFNQRNKNDWFTQSIDRIMSLHAP